MKNILPYDISCIIVALILSGCNTSGRISSFSLENPLLKERVDEAFVLDRAQLNPTNEEVPLMIDPMGNPVSCQLDDLDGDGEWDQLAFVYSFKPSEKVRLQVRWVQKENYPVFTTRTNIRFGKMTSPGVIEELKTDSHGKYNLPRGPHMYPYQMDGPAWENDKMGFRHYFDGRNSRDVFGKRVPDMVLDTVGILPDRTPGDTYHVLAKWGRDIMSAGNSFGLGGLAILTPDSLVRMGVPAHLTEDVINSTRYTLITEGPIRSVFRLNYYGWDVNGQKIDIEEEVTIWAGKYGYENKVTTTALAEGSCLVTGIVANFNDMPFREEVYDHRLLSMLTHDKQTYNKEYYFGMGLILPLENVIETFHTPNADDDIIKTWCVKMKPTTGNTYKFHVYAAWELGDPVFQNRDAFVALIDKYAEEINHPVIMQP